MALKKYVLDETFYDDNVGNEQKSYTREEINCGVAAWAWQIWKDAGKATKRDDGEYDRYVSFKLGGAYGSVLYAYHSEMCGRRWRWSSTVAEWILEKFEDPQCYVKRCVHTS